MGASIQAPQIRNTPEPCIQDPTLIDVCDESHRWHRQLFPSHHTNRHKSYRDRHILLVYFHLDCVWIYLLLSVCYASVVRLSDCGSLARVPRFQSQIKLSLTCTRQSASTWMRILLMLQLSCIRCRVEGLPVHAHGCQYDCKGPVICQVLADPFMLLALTECKIARIVLTAPEDAEPTASLPVKAASFNHQYRSCHVTQA